MIGGCATSTRTAPIKDISAIPPTLAHSSSSDNAVRNEAASFASLGDVVGGGVFIHWKAPAEGTVFVIETNSNTFVLTEHVRKGADFVFDVEEWQFHLSIAFPDPNERVHFIARFLASENID